MAPEQLLGGDLDGRTDLYATGLILYEMATGQRAFAELSSGKLLDAMLHRPPVPPRQLNPKISRELERIISKCLEKSPVDRYQSARDLAVDLRRLQRDSTAEFIDSTPAGPDLARTLFRKKSFLAMLATILLLTAVGAILSRVGLRDILPHVLNRAPQVQSIAVLPLANLSGDPEREFFADGVTEELITQLGKSTGLRVSFLGNP